MSTNVENNSQFAVFSQTHLQMYGVVIYISSWYACNIYENLIKSIFVDNFKLNTNQLG